MNTTHADQSGSSEPPDGVCPNETPLAAVSLVVIDVLVVGFGPVGAVIANLLGCYGIQTLVIDKATHILNSPRAIALDNDALRILQMAGLPEEAFEKIAIPYVRMHSTYFGEFASINTAGSVSGHPKLVTFYQPDLERALRAKLAEHASVIVSLGVELLEFTESEDGVVASLRSTDGINQTVRARYLVGADGASSLVRHLIGQEFRGNSYAEDWLIIDAHKVPRPIDHIEFLCDTHRPTPHMVAPGERERWEFMLRPGENRQQMEGDKAIQELLAPWGHAEEMHIERKAVYRFHARTVNAFSKGRVFLAGDAAHITPPFVGQGLVSGLRDAANLSWKLAWVINGLAAPTILASYDEERRPHAKAMIQLAKLMGRLVMPKSTAIALLTHGAMRLVRMIPPARSYLENLGVKPKNRFPTGLFVRGRSRSRLRRGDLLPQGWIRASGKAAMLSDDALGPHMTLIGFGLDVADYLDDSMVHTFAAAGGVILQIGHRGQRLHRRADEGYWEDLENTFLPTPFPYGWAALVRPDRTVIHDGPASEASRLIHEALSTLGFVASASRDVATDEQLARQPARMH